MNQQPRHAQLMTAERIYTALLRLYPRAHRAEYGALMLQAFKDAYRDAYTTDGRIGIAFWLDALADVVTSAAREQWATLQGVPLMYRIEKHPGVFTGLALGGLATIAVVWTNVLFPNNESDSEYRALYLLVYAALFVVLIGVGLLASRRSNRIRSGARAGVIAALLGGGITLAAFFAVDNLFLSVVSQQVDKLQSFHQSSFATMREYINIDLLTSVLIALPILGAMGALGGTLGAAARPIARRLSLAK